VQELFCYLLLHRERSHAREALASLLWGDHSTAQSKNYLRKALWQMLTALECEDGDSNHRLLVVEPDWVHFDPQADLWLDAAHLEEAAALVQGIPGRDLNPESVHALQEATALYQGELLEGCYWEWCIYERERFQHLYLIMLDKLMDYCEFNGLYEAGLQYGMQILRFDQARERTHRCLMRLHYRNGSRSAALRQYERCADALADELGVKPARLTTSLYEQIRTERLDWATPSSTGTDAESAPVPAVLIEALDRLKLLCTILVDIQLRVQQDVQEVELSLTQRD